MTPQIHGSGKVVKNSTLGQQIQLPSPHIGGRMSVEQAINERRSVRLYRKTETVQLEEISQILWAAQGITSDEGLRTAPSAGALFPLELYLVAGNVRNLQAGVYHYEPHKHVLRRVLSGDVRVDLHTAAMDQEQLHAASAIIVIAAVYDRSTAKYLERGRRYVDFEVGHVSQNIYLQATALGLGTVAVGAFQESEVKRVLEISEEPLYLMPLGKR